MEHLVRMAQGSDDLAVEVVRLDAGASQERLRRHPALGVKDQGANVCVESHTPSMLDNRSVRTSGPLPDRPDPTRGGLVDGFLYDCLYLQENIPDYQTYSLK